MMATKGASIPSNTIAFASSINVLRRVEASSPSNRNLSSISRNNIPLAARTRRAAGTTMLFEKIRDLTNTILKQMSMPSSNSSNTSNVLDGNRSIILVTGASGKTGSCIMKEILSSGIATKIIAHVSPRTGADDIPKEWTDSKIVETCSADLGTAAGVDTVISAAKSAGVGSVVYAASGGVDNTESVENIALEQLISGLQSRLAPDSVRLFDFPGGVGGFSPLDDVVMGGRSSSSMVQDGSFGKFTGNVTTQGGGGFAQTRAPLSASLLAAEEGVETIDLSAYDGISIRVRGDGTPRNYKLNLKGDDISDFAFQAMFSVEGNTAWKTLRIPFDAFIPMRRGVPDYSNVPGDAVYASTLDLARVRTIGIVLSLVYAKVKVPEGEFYLNVSDISAYRNEAPRFVLCSSAAVTRPFWSEAMRKSRGDTVTNIPIVKLNPGNILGYKLRGENILRREAKTAYAIVRPIGLNDEVAIDRKIKLDQGDMLSGTMNRADLARGIVSALRSKDAAFKTFEVGVNQAIQSENNQVTDEEFAQLTGVEMENVYEDEISAALKPAAEVVQ